MVLLSACDAGKDPAPPSKVAAQLSVETSVTKPAQTATPVEPSSEKASQAAAQVHALKPNMSVVPVVAASRSDPPHAAASEQKTASANAKSAKVKADNAEIAHRAPVASKSKAASKVVRDTHLPKAALDLSLPPEMVKQLAPPPGVITAASKPRSPAAGAKPLLPKMFPDAESDSDFQLQGRLLSNEMQLQLRNDSRKDVEGAALDFKFKQ
ncbi:translation initiation factor 2 [Pseudomonas sp. LP_7_YM]|uniref:translation initiation factor 2 n=1 Tax=Pseudomonas sp. LP_7_YM TaxID=2485137 RepID=UPI00273F22C3|nr:translation initiation factor 2 [Pseudomonas sp. LP_7_YM]